MGKTSEPHVAVSHLKSHIGFWMRMVSNQVSHAFARKLENCGVSVAEWVVMREMYGESQTSPSVVAGRIGMTRGAITKLIDRLLAKGLVLRRESSGSDRRYQEIVLTASGRRLIPALAALADQNDEEFFHPLSRKERAMILNLLEKLVQAHGLEKLPTE